MNGRITGETAALFAAWHAAFGAREATVTDACSTKNRELRKAIQDATGKPVDKSGNSLGGYFRKAVANPVAGWEVSGRRMPGYAHPPMLWTVRPTAAGVPVTATQATDDDRLLAVLSRAMGQRVISGAQADRILSLWCEETA